MEQNEYKMTHKMRQNGALNGHKMEQKMTNK